MIPALNTAHETARRVLFALRSLAPIALSAAPITVQIFAGAACTR
jgi:hypothetical protein